MIKFSISFAGFSKCQITEIKYIKLFTIKNKKRLPRANYSDENTSLQYTDYHSSLHFKMQRLKSFFDKYLLFLICKSIFVS